MMCYEGNRGGELSRLTTEALSLHSLIVKELSHPSCARRHGKCSRVNFKASPNIQTRYRVGSRAVGTANRCRGSFCVTMQR